MTRSRCSGYGCSVRCSTTFISHPWSMASKNPRMSASSIPSCAKTRPSRHRRKNRASRNQTQTLARERVPRRPPTFDCRSTHRWRRRVRPAPSSHRSMTGLNRAIKAGSTFCGAQRQRNRPGTTRSPTDVALVPAQPDPSRVLAAPRGPQPRCPGTSGTAWSAQPVSPKELRVPPINSVRCRNPGLSG